MFCKKCGEAIAEDAIFCPKCGQKQVEESPAMEKGKSNTEELTTKDAVSGGISVIQLIVSIVLVVVGCSALLSTCS